MIRDLFDPRNDALIGWLNMKCEATKLDSDDNCITPDGIILYDKCHECRYYIGSIEFPELYKRK